MADREVVPRRIVAVDPRQRCRDVARHFPAWTLQTRELEATADANDVGVERHDELGGRNPRPDAQVERVVSDHPSKKEIQALARAALRRAGKEVADAWALRDPAVCGAKVERHRARGKAVER
jgi:hypothetical protein